MTASGAPKDDDPGLEQEGIWEEPAAAAAGSSTDANQGSSGAGGLTSRLTSTAQLPGPGGLVYADLPNRIIDLIIDVIVLSVVGFFLAWLFGGLVSEPGALDSAGG